MIETYMTREQTLREDYKIDIDLFYQNVQYSYKKGVKSYGSIQNYAKDYIRKVKKMYLETRDPRQEHLNISEMVILMTSLEKKKMLSEHEKHLKNDLHDTLIARRLLEEAILFVGDEMFDKIRRRIVSKRNKAKNKRPASTWL